MSVPGSRRSQSTTALTANWYGSSRRRPAAAFDESYQFAVKAVVDWDRLEPGTDIHAVIGDQVASVTPLTWRMTADTDWVPREADGD